MNPSDPTQISQDPLHPGQSFRGFEILEVLGRGGMGVVYLAKQTALDRLVALKILPPDKAAFADFGARFEREAKALAALAHPNIVGIHDFGKENGLYFFVMEYVEGRTLRGMKLAPDERYTTVTEFKTAVRDALAQASPPAKERSPLLVVLPIFGVILTLAFILLLYVMRDTPKPTPPKHDPPPTFALGDPQVLEGHSLGILSVAFHPKAQVVATGCADTEVRLWDLQAGKRPRVFTEPTAQIFAVAFSADGTLLATGSSDKSMRVWPVKR